MEGCARQVGGSKSLEPIDHDDDDDRWMMVWDDDGSYCPTTRPFPSEGYYLL